MPKGKTPRIYQYQEGDNPLTLAQQFNTTPQAIFDANPGGYPFVTGQGINLPIAGLGGKRPGYNVAPAAPVGSPSNRPFAPLAAPPPIQPSANALPTQAALQQQRMGEKDLRTGLTVNTGMGTFDPNRVLEAYKGVDFAMLPGGRSDQEALLKYMQESGQLPQGITVDDLLSISGSVPGGEQRLDASGNVWDPKTAKTDIYGGQFKQVGQTEWGYNAKGKYVKFRYGKGGKKVQITGGAGQSKKKNTTAAGGGNATGFGVVQFGAGAG